MPPDPIQDRAATRQGDRRRARIINFVADYWTTYGYAPSLREIAAGTNMTSPSAAAYHVDVLVGEGRLARARDPRIPRSIRVVEQ
jgi:SOS-response transcriptional repressor LexA